MLRLFRNLLFFTILREKLVGSYVMAVQVNVEGKEKYEGDEG